LLSNRSLAFSPSLFFSQDGFEFFATLSAPLGAHCYSLPGALDLPPKRSPPPNHLAKQTGRLVISWAADEMDLFCTVMRWSPPFFFPKLMVLRRMVRSLVVRRHVVTVRSTDALVSASRTAAFHPSGIHPRPPSKPRGIFYDYFCLPSISVFLKAVSLP